LTFVVLQFRGLRTTPVALDIIVDPGIQFKAIEGDGLFPQGDLREVRAHVLVEFVAVHSRVTGRITRSDQSG
jgi:hypothetical protein